MEGKRLDRWRSLARRHQATVRSVSTSALTISSDSNPLSWLRNKVSLRRSYGVNCRDLTSPLATSEPEITGSIQAHSHAGYVSLSNLSPVTSYPKMAELIRGDGEGLKRRWSTRIDTLDAQTQNQRFTHGLRLVAPIQSASSLLQCICATFRACSEWVLIIEDGH